MLLLYGDRGIYTPPAHGERLARAFGNAAGVEMHVFPGIEHTFAYRDAGEDYTSRVMPFLGAKLRAGR